MPRIVKSGLIQMSLPMTEGEGSIQEIMDATYDKHIIENKECKLKAGYGQFIRRGKTSKTVI